MNESPKWNRGDTIKSIVEVSSIGLAALKACVIDAADWLDTKVANRLNGAEDET